MRRTGAVVGAAVLALIVTATAVAADPAAAPPPSCRDRFPEAGPGGLDLGILCTLSEVVGSFTGAGGPAQTSPAVIVTTVGLFVAILLSVWLVVRTARRGAARRLASVTPTAWWVCSSCSSFNPPTGSVCYACGAAASPDAVIAPTAMHPPSRDP